MPTTIYPANYLSQIDNPAKSFNVVLVIDGLSYLFCMQNVSATITYGGGITYGSGYHYGDTGPSANSKPYIVYNSSMNITQTLEPEQGRASITTFATKITDINGLVTEVVSPGGNLLPEILGRSLNVYFGFANTIFPDDYYIAYRGMISEVVVDGADITITHSDKGQKRRVGIFQVQKALTTNTITNVQTTIPVDDATQFYEAILGPDATYDTAVKLYCIIENEVIQYSTITAGTTINVAARGARDTTAVAHNTIGTDVTPTVQIQDHALNCALKIMLSGWAGPYITGVSCSRIGNTSSTLLLLGEVDANLIYGLTVGDYVTISASTMGNNGTYLITAMTAFNGTLNNSLTLNTTSLVNENPASSAQLAFRSKYDTLPTDCGLSLTPMDVDVLGHESLRDNFLNNGEYTLQLYIQSQQNGKDFIEKECYLAIGCYSLTRYGQLSVNQTRPPIATQSLQFLNLGNIIDPDKIVIKRGINTRKFFNNIQYQYDQNDDSTYSSVLRVLDTDSLNNIGLNQILPIQSNGIKTSLGGAALVTSVSNKFLSRYKNSAYEITLKCIFQVGTLIEVGDIVCLQDNGYLQLSNFDTGSRDLGTQLYEVTHKALNISTGVVTLKLTSGVQGQAADRFGTVSPSSIITSSTSTTLTVQASYNVPGVTDESYKWIDYIGLPIIVHDNTWTNQTQVTLVSAVDMSGTTVLGFSGALGYSPAAGDIVDIPYYPTSTTSSVNATYKAIHAFLDPTVPILTGVDNFSFTVSAGNISKFVVGSLLYLRDSTFTVVSSDVTISAVDTGTNKVTVGTTLGFTPTSDYSAELIGFADSGAGYRIF